MTTCTIIITHQGDEFTPHPRVATTLDEFAKAYSSVKNPRKLVCARSVVPATAFLADTVGESVVQDWVPHRGLVELDLEFGDDEVHSFKVTPLEATVIMHFQEGDTGKETTTA